MLPNKVLYWTGGVKGEKDAEITQLFQETIITRPTEWLVAVERCEISLNKIPWNPGGTVTIRRIADGVVRSVTNIRPSFSFVDFLDIFETDTRADPFAQHMRIRMREDTMRMRIFTNQIYPDGAGHLPPAYNLFPLHQIELSRSLADSIGCHTTLNANHPLYDPVLGVISLMYPRIDAGDQLSHIVLTTNLPVASDRLGQKKTKVLTDFSIGSASDSVMTKQPGLNDNWLSSSVSYSPRARLIYAPSMKRFVNLRSEGPLQQFQVTAWWSDQENNLQKVPLDFGGQFTLKLGFYSIR